MKRLKRITVVTIAVIMTSALAGCGEKSGVIKEAGNLIVPTLGDVEIKTIPAPTQKSTQEPTQQFTQTQADMPDAISFLNTTYVIPEGFEAQDDMSGTKLYAKNVDGVYASTIAYYVQSETIYTALQMQEAYKSTIESVYGTCSDISVKKINSRDYTQYLYKDYLGPEGILDVSIYVYSDGKTTVYTEFACVDGYTEGQSDIDAFMNSINIK